MGDNPWLVDSIHSFSVFKCPECIFDSIEEYNFQDHAIQNHPLSFVFFGKPGVEMIKGKSLSETLIFTSTNPQ